jgi:hypothetical protein
VCLAMELSHLQKKGTDRQSGRRIPKMAPITYPGELSR